MKKNTRMLTLFILALLISVFAMFTFTQSAYSKKYGKDNQNFEGKVYIGKFGLHACKISNGKPSIIFESGHYDTHEAWELIQPEISSISSTLSYDRACIGLSDKSPAKRTSLNKAYELHKLLKKAKVKGPYIIVTHSMGSWVARMFAEQFGNELAGLIFIDPTHEDTNEYTINSMPPDFLNLYKEEIRKEGTYEDLLESIEQIKEARYALETIPLTVISATNHLMGPEFEEKWLLWQKDIASLSSKSNHIIVNSGHNIHKENPDVIIKAIKDMITKS